MLATPIGFISNKAHDSFLEHSRQFVNTRIFHILKHTLFIRFKVNCWMNHDTAKCNLLCSEVSGKKKNNFTSALPQIVYRYTYSIWFVQVMMEGLCLRVERTSTSPQSRNCDFGFHSETMSGRKHGGIEVFDICRSWFQIFKLNSQ